MVNLQNKMTILDAYILYLGEFSCRNEVHNKFGFGCIPIWAGEPQQ